MHAFQTPLPRLLTAAVWLAIGLACPLAARASDGHPAPAVAKPAVAPASGAMSPFKAKAAEPAAHGETASAKPAAAAPAPGPAAKAGNDVLNKMLTERLAGSGEVVLKTGDPSPLQAAPRKRAAAKPPAADAHAAAKATEHLPHWSYDGAGAPDKWASLDPANATCANGKRQSPIDIRDGIAVNLESVKFDYQPTAFRVLDNGHTVQVNLAAGNSIEVMGRRYELLQFHFHRPSEERVNGKGFDMVAHLVHRDAEGRLAVVAVLLTKGAAQPVLQAVWNSLPLERNEEQAAPASLDLQRLLPEDQRYYTYMGSLTTPPCSEGVLWVVLKAPMQVSAEQIAVFAKLYPMNARPLQGRSGRLIKESN